MIGAVRMSAEDRMAGDKLRRALDGAIERLARRITALFEEALRAQFPPRAPRRSRRRPIAIRAIGPQPWPANTNGAELLDELGRYAEGDAFGQLGAPLVVALMTASVLMTRPPLRGSSEGRRYSATIVPRM